MRYLKFTDLAGKGVIFTRRHVARLVAEGRFPRPVKLAPDGRAIAWPEPEIDAYMAARLEERDRSVAA
jgi:prophage regulatory protein